jgi:hypothetical protein
VLIKVLFVVLVLCALALFGAVIAAFVRVRRQMRKPGSAEAPVVTESRPDDQAKL